MLKVSAPELVSGVSGESEQKLRELFEQAVVGPLNSTLSPSPLLRVMVSVVSKGTHFNPPPRTISPRRMERQNCCIKGDLLCFFDFYDL